MTEFSGLGMHLGNLSRLSNAKSRSISPENFSGDPGKGGMATEGTGAHRARGLGQALPECRHFDRDRYLRSNR